MEAVGESVETELNNWVSHLRAKIINFEPTQIQNVLDDYFIGSGAFKSQKNREDFPDSMIHHSICRLVNEVGELHVILSDGAFKRGISGQENIVTLNSLNDLLSLDGIKQHIESELLNEYFAGTQFANSLKHYLNEQKEIVENIYISEDIDNTNIIGIKLYGAELNFPSPEDISELTIQNFYAISDSEFTADISFQTNATMHYVRDYGSYLEISRDSSRDIDLDSMNGEGMCDLIENVLTQYSGNIYLSFEDPQTIETVEPIMQNLVSDDAPVTIVIDIEMANLLKTVA